MARRPKTERVRRIVIFEADAKQFSVALKDIQRSSAQAAQSLGRIDRAMKQTAAASKSTARSIASVQASINKFAALTRGLGLFYLVQQFYRLGESIVRFGGDIVTASDSLEMMKLRIERLGAGTADISSIADIANNLGITLADAADNVALLAPAFERLGVPFEKVTTFASDLVRALRVYGTDARRAQIVTVQLAQALSSGKLAGDELRSLNENAGALGLALERAVQESLGTTEALTELGSQGKLTTDIILAGFEKAFAGIRGDIDALPNILQYQTNRMKNAFTQLFDYVDDKLRLSDFYEFLTEGITGGLENLLVKLDANLTLMSTESLQEQLFEFSSAVDESTAKVNELREAIANSTARSTAGLRAALVKSQEDLNKALEAELRIRKEIERRTQVSQSQVAAPTKTAYEQLALEERTYVDLIARVIKLKEVEKARLAEILPLLDKYAEKYKVSRDLIIAVARQESRFNQAATSPVGARGVMQVMPGTAQDISRAINIPADKILNDIEANIDAGVYYLAQRIKQFGGDVEKALAGYNWGPFRKLLQVEGPLDLSKVPEETRNYVKKITQDWYNVSDALGNVGIRMDAYADRQKALTAAEKERKSLLDGTYQTYEKLKSSLDPLYALERQRADSLIEVIEIQKQFNLTMEETQVLIDQVNKRFEENKKKLNEAGEKSAKLDETLRNSALQSMSGWIDSATQGTFRLADAMKQLVAELAALAIKWALVKAVQGAYGAESGIGQAIAGAMGFARGGVVQLQPQFAMPHGVYQEPTVFPMKDAGFRRFAKGIGLLGEAGPEAILPLARTSSGDLGVKAETRPTEVVINNYTGAQVSTNRRQLSDRELIEVAVGEMTSAIGRGGTTASRTLESTYGLKRGR